MFWRLWLLVVPDQASKGRTLSPIELFWTAKKLDPLVFGWYFVVVKTKTSTMLHLLIIIFWRMWAMTSYWSPLFKSIGVILYKSAQYSQVPQPTCYLKLMRPILYASELSTLQCSWGIKGITTRRLLRLPILLPETQGTPENPFKDPLDLFEVFITAIQTHHYHNN